MVLSSPIPVVGLPNTAVVGNRFSGVAGVYHVVSRSLSRAIYVRILWHA